AEQRAGTYGALGLLAAGVLEVNKRGVAAMTADRRLRAASVFPRPLLVALFLKLGQPETPTAMLRGGGSESTPPLPVHALWDCDCSTQPQQSFCGALVTGPETCIS